MKPIAERHAAFEEFEKECRKKLPLPPDPREACSLVNELEIRLIKGEEPEFIMPHFTTAVDQWFSKGYLAAGARMLPLRTFLREFYDNHKNVHRQIKYEIEDLSKNEQNKSSKTAGQSVKLTVEGEGLNELYCHDS